VLGEEFEQSDEVYIGGKSLASLGISMNGFGIDYYGLPPRISKVTVIGIDDELTLVCMNDGSGRALDDGSWKAYKKASFKKIANWIEKNL